MTKICASSSYKENKGARQNLTNLAAELGAPKGEKDTLTDLTSTVSKAVSEQEKSLSSKKQTNQRLTDDAKTASTNLDGLKSKYQQIKQSRRRKQDENAIRTNSLSDLEEQIKDLKEANRKIASDFDDNRAAIEELADWQSAVGISIDSVKQDFEAYARGIEEQAEIIRAQVGEERILLTNNQIALQEQHEQLKFEKNDLETRYKREMQAAGDALKHNKIDIEQMKIEIKDLQDNINRRKNQQSSIVESVEDTLT